MGFKGNGSGYIRGAVGDGNQQKMVGGAPGGPTKNHQHRQHKQ